MPGSDGKGPLRLRLRGSGMRFVRIDRAAALIHDMRQPDGYLRYFLNRIMHRKPTIRLIDVQHTSIEDNTKEKYKDTLEPFNKGKERTPK
jgi:hypothetical protein